MKYLGLLFFLLTKDAIRELYCIWEDEHKYLEWTVSGQFCISYIFTCLNPYYKNNYNPIHPFEMDGWMDNKGQSSRSGHPVSGDTDDVTIVRLVKLNRGLFLCVVARQIPGCS